MAEGCLLFHALPSDVMSEDGKMLERVLYIIRKIKQREAQEQAQAQATAHTPAPR